MHDSFNGALKMKKTLTLISQSLLWIGTAVTVAGLAGCDSDEAATLSAMNSAVAVDRAVHPCRSPDAMSTQKGCRPSTVTVGTK